MKKVTNSTEETIALGRKIGASLHGGDVVTLTGDLGSGKTTFTKGIAQALGAEGMVTSPTFTLIQVHPIKKTGEQLAHIDTYRTESIEECINAGITDMLYNKKTICVIEWPSKVKTLLKKQPIRIELKNDGESHTITFPDDLLKETHITKKNPIAYWLFFIIMIMFYTLLYQAVTK